MSSTTLLMILTGGGNAMRKAFPTKFGFTMMCALVLPCSPSEAATCGSEQVRQIIESQSADQISTAKKQLESTSSRNEFGDGLLRLYSQGLNFHQTEIIRSEKTEM